MPPTRERRARLADPDAAFGYYRMKRGWMDHPVFGKEPFSRAQAWAWLIEEAAFKPRRKMVSGRMIELKRGQLAHSIRFMAEAWRWKKTNTERFIARLKTETMIRTETGTGVTVITVCNYDIYQASPNMTGTETGAENGTKLGQQRDTTGTNENKQQPIPSSNTSTESYSSNSEPSIERGAQGAPEPDLDLPDFLDKRKKNGKGEPYAWTGRVVRLAAKDLEKWRTSYHRIPDLEAELQKADDYYADNPPPNGKWFFPVSKWLEREHNDRGSGGVGDPRRDPAYWDDKADKT